MAILQKITTVLLISGLISLALFFVHFPSTNPDLNLIFAATEAQTSVPNLNVWLAFTVYLPFLFIMFRLMPKSTNIKMLLTNLVVGAEAGLCIGLLANILGGFTRVNNYVLMDAYIAVIAPIAAILTICFASQNASEYLNTGNSTAYWQKTIFFTQGLTTAIGFTTLAASESMISLIAYGLAFITAYVLSSTIFAVSVAIKKLIPLR